jgi:HD superfamily phosphodiesterase
LKEEAYRSLADKWRDQILESITHLFENRYKSQLYGIGHALATEAAALEILAAPEHRCLEVADVIVLQSAVLLHDIGFSRRTKSWLPDHFEHVEIGKQIASEILAQNAWYRDKPERIKQVLWLIEHHDDTTYSFPSATYDGHPILPNRPQNDRHLNASLSILQEADSRVHGMTDCVQEASQDWLDQGVPPFADCGVPLATWRWMDSVVGNIRLIGKRSILDAHTKSGEQAALELYDRLEDRIRKQCDLAGAPYEAEVCPPAMRQASVARFAGKSFDLQMVTFQVWGELEQALRSISLLYDKAMHPYQQARVRLELVDLNGISPMALYTMRNRLEEVLELHDALMVTYCLGIWDLPGLLEFRYNSAEIQRIAPPIVEEYTEAGRPGNTPLRGLMDGLHRCSTARAMGLSKVRAIVASDVPYPLMPLPVDWAEIQTYEDRHPPPTSLKRRFRYQSLSDFPFNAYQTSVAVTQDNFQYFFYRDLSPLGSKGKRDFREFESKKAE